MKTRFLFSGALAAFALVLSACGDDTTLLVPNLLFDSCNVTADPDAHEPDDTFAQAEALPGIAKNLTITDLTMDDGIDIYKIVVTSIDSTITLTFTHAQGDLDLYVLDDEFEVIDASKSSDDNESLFASAPAAGTYYILVNAAGCPPGATAQTYSLFWNDGI
ncbi:MAG: PPC domain-containing protein [Bdellovibrionota bacterium]